MCLPCLPVLSCCSFIFFLFLVINMTRFSVKNSLKFDDSNNGDSTDDKEDEECESKSAVSEKT